MPNMSYCRFENTYNDLIDCLDNINDEAGNERDERYRIRLIKLIADNIDLISDLKDIEPEYQQSQFTMYIHGIKLNDMSKIIKQAVVEPKTVSVGDQVNFIHWIPLQNIGRTTETLSGRVIKVNKVIVTVHCDQDGCVWGVRKDELVDQAEHDSYIDGIKLNT